jgi:hypothetical protein
VTNKITSLSRYLAFLNEEGTTGNTLLFMASGRRYLECEATILTSKAVRLAVGKLMGI